MQFWIKYLCNHLWWCADNCHGDNELLKVATVYPFEGKLFTGCKHDTLNMDIVETTLWTRKKSKAHNTLTERSYITKNII